MLMEYFPCVTSDVWRMTSDERGGELSAFSGGGISPGEAEFRSVCCFAGGPEAGQEGEKPDLAVIMFAA
jgi:hypothetical protein